MELAAGAQGTDLPEFDRTKERVHQFTEEDLLLVGG